MDAITEWKKIKEEEHWKEKIRIKKYKEEEVKEAQEICEILREYGVENLTTNNYWFQFDYKNFFVSFVNQTIRICVTYHKNNLSKDEKKIVEDMNTLKHTHEYLYEKFKKLLCYQNFIIDGNSTRAVKTLMEEINKDIK